MLDPICKLSKLPRKPNLSLMSEIRLLSVTAANKRVISKKLATAFAAIWTVSLPMIISEYYKVILDDTPTRKELTAFARFANAVPWRLAHRDNFEAKAPGHVNGWANAANAFCLYPLAVRRQSEPNRQPVFVREFIMTIIFPVF
jgi:hypothetical protein